MLTPEEQQIETCILKCNLEQIANMSITHRAALVNLNTETEQCYRQTMSASEEVGSQKEQLEQLKLENIRLTTKRMQLKEQLDHVFDCMKKAREHNDECLNLLKQEDDQCEQDTCTYEATLRKKAERFRETNHYYNNKVMVEKVKMANNTITNLENEIGRQQKGIDEFIRLRDNLKMDVPDDVLNILGKKELDEKARALTDKCEAVREKRNELLNYRSNAAQSITKNY